MVGHQHSAEAIGASIAHRSFDTRFCNGRIKGEMILRMGKDPAVTIDRGSAPARGVRPLFSCRPQSVRTKSGERGRKRSPARQMCFAAANPLAQLVQFAQLSNQISRRIGE